MIRLLVACSPGELRVAAVDGAGLADYAIWRPGAPDGLGDEHVGRVIAHVPAMAGAFVALVDAEGFLPDSEGGAGLAAGSWVQARLARSAQGGKGPRLAGGTPAPAGPARLLRRGPSPLHRLASRYAAAPIDIDDPARFAELRADFPGRLLLCASVFDAAVADEIETLHGAWADLVCGGSEPGAGHAPSMRAGFFPTPALTAIDLDMAAATAGPRSKASAQFAANRAAVAPLCRQIRLRNLSGALMVDFAGLPIRRRVALTEDLESALAADPAGPRLLGFSRLGLAEILRPRGAPPLHELLAGSHAAGLAALRRLAAAVKARPGLQPVLRAAPAVVAALQADAVALSQFAALAAHALVLRSDPALPPDSCELDAG